MSVSTCVLAANPGCEGHFRDAATIKVVFRTAEKEPTHSGAVSDRTVEVRRASHLNQSPARIAGLFFAAVSNLA